MQEKIPPHKKPKTYFELIERVGSGGKYQFNLMILCFFNWFVCGVILMSTAFLFLNKKFSCKEIGLLTDNCKQSVCRLPKSQRLQYVAADNFKSIATDFGEYYCQDEFYLDFTSSMVYFGAFVGYIVISFFSDNFGRRSSILIAWSITTIGVLILIMAQNLVMVGIGLFLAGLGSDSAANVCFFIISEVVQDSKRQTYSIIILSAFCFSALLETFMYMLVPNWYIVTILFIVVPCIIQLFILFLYLEETPRYLIQKGIQPTLKALNRIGKINLGIKDVLQEADIQSVIQQIKLVKQNQSNYITILDLFKFPSLRIVTICCSVAAFCIYAMYYGPILIVSSVGFDIYTSNIVLQMSDAICYLPTYYIIAKLPRQLTGYIMFSIAGFCSGILIFVKKPQECNFCKESIIELVFIFIFRFAISFYFSVFLIYTNQVYPSKARGLGTGVINAFGTVASTVSPLYLGAVQRSGINVMIVFTIFSIIAFASIMLMHQTKGIKLNQEIVEVKLLKNKIKSNKNISSDHQIQK